MQMHDDFNAALEDFTPPRALFSQSHDTNPRNLTGAETTPTETPQENGVTLPLLTHLSPKKSPPVDAPEAPASPLPLTCAESSAVACLESESNLPLIFLMAAADTLFGVDQDWVHQNTSTQLDEGIDKNGKWKA